MSHIIIIVLSFFSISLSTTTQNIEKSFLQENPQILLSLFPEHSHINVSIPDPISFSDYVSSQQAFFLFRKIFSSYATFEFYSDRQLYVQLKKTFIVKASWSFRDRRNDTQYVYHIFFYLTFEKNKI
ncbi:MAG: hypothetical protein KAX11_07700, partial [Candidatus Aminicenantes bacterium]|nr:hypothetical protein [Candidatus Aminicenantes bacterium]